MERVDGVHPQKYIESSFSTSQEYTEISDSSLETYVWIRTLSNDQTDAKRQYLHLLLQNGIWIYEYIIVFRS